MKVKSTNTVNKFDKHYLGGEEDASGFNREVFTSL